MAPFTYSKGPQDGDFFNEKSDSDSGQKRRKSRRERREYAKRFIVNRQLDLAFVVITKRNGKKVEGRLRLVPHRDKQGEYRDKVFVETNDGETEVDTGDITNIEELF